MWCSYINEYVCYFLSYVLLSLTSQLVSLHVWVLLWLLCCTFFLPFRFHSYIMFFTSFFLAFCFATLKVSQHFFFFFFVFFTIHACGSFTFFFFFSQGMVFSWNMITTAYIVLTLLHTYTYLFLLLVLCSLGHTYNTGLSSFYSNLVNVNTVGFRNSKKVVSPLLVLYQACHHRIRFLETLPTETQTVEQREELSYWRELFVRQYSDKRMRLIRELCQDLVGNRKVDMEEFLTMISDPRRMNGCQSIACFPMGYVTCDRSR